MSESLVSIIVPCYNQAIYLAESLQSVLDQVYSNWECIIVNDGSPDNTEEVSYSFCEKDSRFRYLYKVNGGLSSARNAGIQAAKGKYILPLDADDLISPNYLNEAVQILDFDRDVKLVYAKAKYFGAKSGEWKMKLYSFRNLLQYNMIYCSAFFRREDFEKTKGYNTNMKKGLEDWDFWLSLLTENDKVIQIPHFHFFYRIKDNSMLTSITEAQYEELYLQVFKNHSDLYFQYMNPITCMRELSYYKKKYMRMKRRYSVFEKIFHPFSLLK